MYTIIIEWGWGNNAKQQNFMVDDFDSIWLAAKYIAQQLLSEDGKCEAPTGDRYEWANAVYNQHDNLTTDSEFEMWSIVECQIENILDDPSVLTY